MTLHLTRLDDAAKTRCGMASALVSTLNNIPTWPPHVAELCEECAASTDLAEPGPAYQCTQATFRRLRELLNYLDVQDRMTPQQQCEFRLQLALVVGQFQRARR